MLKVEKPQKAENTEKKPAPRQFRPGRKEEKPAEPFIFELARVEMERKKKK